MNSKLSICIERSGLSWCSSDCPGTLERTVCLCLLSAGWQQRRAPPHRQTLCSCFPRAKRTRTGGPQNSDFRFQCSGVAGGVRCVWGCVHRNREGVWNTGARLSCGPGQACLWVVRRYGNRKWIEEAGQAEPSCWLYLLLFGLCHSVLATPWAAPAPC